MGHEVLGGARGSSGPRRNKSSRDCGEGNAGQTANSGRAAKVHRVAAGGPGERRHLEPRARAR
eukprot:2989173-Alexandrium_andersonii.AAC.1